MKTVQQKRFLPKIMLAGILILGSGGWSSSSQAAPVTYGGDAQVVHVGLNLLSLLGPGIPINVDLVQTGQLPAGGGFLEQHLLTIGDPSPIQVSLLADVASAVSSGSGFESYSQANVAGVSLGLGPITPTTLAVNATVLQANAQATCVAPPSGGVALTGSSVVTALKINGQDIIVTGAPNQTINVTPLIKIVINEQIKSSTATSGSITVNALHITLIKPDSLLGNVLTGDVVISHANASINNCAAKPPCPDVNNPICVVCPDPTNPACPPVCPDPNNPLCPATCPDPNNPNCPSCTVKDFITGGGQIASKNGRNITFSTHGGIHANGSLMNGHLNVVDRTGGLHIQDTGDYGYIDPSPTSTKRKLSFNCTGASGTTCIVNEADNGEPGTADTWQMSSGSYSIGSTSAPIAHGNIQLHKPAGCSAPPPVTPAPGGKKPRK